MMIVKEPMEDKVRTTSVLFGLFVLLGGIFFWKIFDMSSQIDRIKRETHEDILLLTDDLHRTQKRVTEIQEAGTIAFNSIERVKTDIFNDKKVIEGINKELEGLKASNKKLTANQSKSSQNEAELKKTQTALNEALNRLETSNKELARLNIQSKQLAQTVEALTIQLEDFKIRLDQSPQVKTGDSASTKPWWKFWGK